MFNRRNVLSYGAATLAFAGLGRFVQAGEEAAGYGPLLTPDALSGTESAGPLALPDGFSQHIISRAGQRMSDGLLTPAAFDGMAAFPGPDGRIILIRNHELAPGVKGGAFGDDYALLTDDIRQKMFDSGPGRYTWNKKNYEGPYLGGTTTLVWNPATGELEQEFLSLTGTCRNCAGGPTPWGSWLTCEEPNLGTSTGHKVMEGHGYVFEVQADPALGLQRAVPLTGLGRFNHEAAAVCPVSGCVYMTEDLRDGVFYRFVPLTPGRLADGGQLQALALVGLDGFNTDNHRDTESPVRLRPGVPLAVRWIDLDDPMAPKDDLRHRAHAAGAALFRRGEGLWRGGKGEIYFTATEGGANRRGQIFRYWPSRHEGQPQEQSAPGQLELFIEPNDRSQFNMADNLTVAPWGDLIVCEDGDGGEANHLRGITPQGRIYTLARNIDPAGSELCGACFSPDGKWLLVNIQSPGYTIAVTGPWEHRQG